MARRKGVTVVLPKGATEIRELTRRVIPPAVREVALAAGATEATRIILARTRKGVAIDGSSFAKYSPGYAKQRADAGRNVSPPDLTLSGQMLGALGIVSRSADVAKVGFRQGGFGTAITKSKRPRKGRKTGRPITHAVTKTAARLDGATKAIWNNARRPFFGLSADERKRVGAAVARATRQNLSR